MVVVVVMARLVVASVWCWWAALLAVVGDGIELVPALVTMGDVVVEVVVAVDGVRLWRS